MKVALHISKMKLKTYSKNLAEKFNKKIKTFQKKW